MSTHFTADTPSGAVAQLEQHGARTLAESIVNDALNRLIGNYSESLFGHLTPGGDDRGQPIPFAGWYWRNVDFLGRFRPVIAATPAGTVICENNKWGYAQRQLTPEESDAFLALVWNALLESRKGGDLASIQRATREALEQAGAFIAALTVNPWNGDSE